MRVQRSAVLTRTVSGRRGCRNATFAISRKATRTCWSSWRTCARAWQRPAIRRSSRLTSRCSKRVRHPWPHSARWTRSSTRLPASRSLSPKPRRPLPKPWWTLRLPKQLMQIRARPTMPPQQGSTVPCSSQVRSSQKSRCLRPSKLSMPAWSQGTVGGSGAQSS